MFMLKLTVYTYLTAYTGGVHTISIYFMTSVSSESCLSKEIITLYDLYPNNSIKKEKTNILECMFIRGGNCVRMDMGKVLSNKIITVTDTCAV